MSDPGDEMFDYEGYPPDFDARLENHDLRWEIERLTNAVKKARWALEAMVTLHGPDPAGMALHALNALDGVLSTTHDEIAAINSKRAICCDETASVVCGDCPRRDR